MKYKVLVLLSTYNGERYIRKQIDSILYQKDVNTTILIRDDGSTDYTVKIIKEYIKYNENIVLIEGDNVGFVSSFTKLVEEAFLLPPFDFYAFADQDDVWYENKLIYGVLKLSSLPQNVPNLFGSNSLMIDSSGKPLRPFYNNVRYYTPANLTYEPFVQGCSMLFNKVALDLYCLNPPSKCWHDRWMLMICTYMGNIIYDHRKLFSYRIHSRNTLMKRKESNNMNSFALVANYLSCLLNSERPQKHQEFMFEFYEKFNNKILAIHKEYIIHYLKYDKNMRSKMFMLLSGVYTPVIRKHNILSWAQLKLDIILNRK